MSSLAVIGVLLIGVGTLQAAPAAAAGSGVLSISLAPVDYATGQPQTTAGYGEHGNFIAYRVNFSCGAAACDNTVVQFTPPQEDPFGLANDADPTRVALNLLSYSTWTAPTTGGTVTGNNTTGRTVNLGNLPAGTSGSFLIVYSTSPAANGRPVPGQFYPQGFQIQNGATISSTTAVAPVSADAAPVTWDMSAVPNPAIVVSNPGTVKPDVNVGYQVRMSSGALPRSGGNITGHSFAYAAGYYTVSLPIPAEAQFVSADRGGVYDPTTRTITWTEGTSSAPTYCAAGGWGDTAAPQNNWNTNPPCYTPRNVVLKYPAANFDADANGCNFDATVSATAQVTIGYLDPARTVKTAAATVANAVSCYDPFGRSTTAKDTTLDNAKAGQVYVPPDVTGMTCPAGGTDDWGRACTPGQPLAAFADNGKFWQVVVRNAGNVPGVATVTDSSLDQADAPVWQVRASATTPAATVAYSYQCGTATPVTGTATVPFTLTAAQRAAGCRITAATVTSGSVAPGNIRPVDNGAGTTFVTYFDYTVTKTAPINVSRTNTATGTMSYPNTTVAPISNVDSATFALVAYPKAAVAKPVMSAGFAAAPVVAKGGNAVPGRDVTFSVNGATASIPVDQEITPQYVFIAPAGWKITPGSAAFAAGAVPPGVVFQLRRVTVAGVQRDAMVATWPNTVAFGKNTTWPTMTVVATPTYAVAAGTTSVAASWAGDSRHTWTNAQATFNGATQDTTDVDGDGVTTEYFATTTQSILVSSTDSVNVTKEICLPDGNGGCTWIGDFTKPVPVSTTATNIRYRVTIQNAGNTTLNGLVAYDVLPYVGDTGTSDGTASTPRGSTFAESLASIDGTQAGLALDFSASSNPPRTEVYSGTTTGTWGTDPTGMQAIRARYTPSVAPGGTVVFSYTAQVGAGSSADARACNSIAVDTTSTLPTEPPAVCAVTSEADLEVTIPDHLPLQVGRPGVLPFTVTNHGGSANAPATVTVDVPAGIAVTSLAPAGWSCASGFAGTAPFSGPVSLTCQPVDGKGAVTTLPLGAPVALSLPVSGLTASGQVCVTAQVTGPMSDPKPANNTTNACAAVAAGGAALAVSKTDGRSVAEPGQTLTYTIAAQNTLAGEQVPGATITDTLPSGVAFVSASDGGTLAGADAGGRGGTVSWPAVTLAQAGIAGPNGSATTGGAGSAVTRTVTVKVSTGANGDVTNRAAIAAADPAAPTQQLTASTTDVDTLQRLTVSKTSDAAPSGVRTGDDVTYTVVASNDGTADYTTANPATVLDDLTAVLDDATYSSGTAAVDGGLAAPIGPNASKHLVWAGALPVGSHVTLSYTVKVGAGADKVLRNTAWGSGTVGTSCQNGVDQDGISCASVQSVFAAVVGKRIQSFTQNDDGTWQIVYAIDVTNPSPVGATTYSLTDSLRFGAGIQVLGPVTITPPTGAPATWDGTGSATLATNATIAAAAQQTYLVSVRADAHQTAGTAAATCTTGVAGGFANTATLTLAGRTPIAAESCASPVVPAITKTVATPEQQPDGSWNVSYTVTVQNKDRSAPDLAYTIRDALAFPAGTAINSIQAAGAGTNPGFDGSGDTALLSGVARIPAPTGAAASTSQAYTVTVNVSAPLGSVAPADLLCGPAGSGGYANTATLYAGTGTTTVGTSSACTPVTMTPMPTITKKVVSSSVAQDGTWSLVYRIAVANGDDTYATHYSLTDALDFAAGVTVQSAQISAPAGVDTTGWDGDGNPVVFSGTRALAAGATDTYTVTVVADPGSLDAESAAADCRIDAGEAGTGFRNIATVTAGGKSVFADACEPATDPSVVKTTVGQPTQDAATGEWTVKYRLTVTNKSVSTSGTIPYTVADTLGFPAGVTVLDVSATDPSGDAVSGFDGVTDTTVGAGAIGAAANVNEPATQVWNVTVKFAVPAGLTQVPGCDPQQGPGGLWNEGEIHVGQRISGSVACVNAPDVPAPVMSKTLVSQKQNADGTWALGYRIDVQNPSATAASTYTLDDDLAFGAGISLRGDASVDLPASVASTGWNGHNSQDIVSNQLLPAGGSHSYTVHVTADAGSVAAADPAGDCTLANGEGGTGFLNTASLDTGAVQLSRSACATTYDPAVTKQLNGQPVQQPDGSWLLSYTMTVSNPSSIQLAYGLVDKLDFPAGTDVTVESATSRSGGPAVESSWDGQSQTHLVADGTALAPNGVHVFDVTVSAVLPADQQTATGGWANTATVESGTGNAITTAAMSTADVRVPRLTIDKTATAGPVVRIGDQVGYHLVVTNTGDGDYTALYPAVVRDDLTGVLDDATLDGVPAVTPAQGSVTGTGDGFHWLGTLASGDSVTIDYTVTAQRGGDADLVNTALQANPLETDPTPPNNCAAPTCVTTDNPMPALTIQKHASTQSVAPGGQIGYTVAVTNNSSVDIPDSDPATATDDLTDVLRNASYRGDVSVTIGTAAITGSTLSWSGGLKAGQTVTITYSVTVNSNAANGAKLVNTAVSDPTLASLNTAGDPDAGRVSTTTTVGLLAVGPVARPENPLAATGSRIAWGIGALALGLLAAGAALLLTRRRRGETN